MQGESPIPRPAQPRRVKPGYRPGATLLFISALLFVPWTQLRALSWFIEDIAVELGSVAGLLFLLASVRLGLSVPAAILSYVGWWMVAGGPTNKIESGAFRTGYLMTRVSIIMVPSSLAAALPIMMALRRNDALDPGAIALVFAVPAVFAAAKFIGSMLVLIGIGNYFRDGRLANGAAAMLVLFLFGFPTFIAVGVLLKMDDHGGLFAVIASLVLLGFWLIYMWVILCARKLGVFTMNAATRGQ